MGKVNDDDCDEMTPLAESGDQRSAEKEKINRCKTVEKWMTRELFLHIDQKDDENKICLLF